MQVTMKRVTVSYCCYHYYYYYYFISYNDKFSSDKNELMLYISIFWLLLIPIKM